jgi:polyhydroxybutyrate depolymerase
MRRFVAYGSGVGPLRFMCAPASLPTLTRVPTGLMRLMTVVAVLACCGIVGVARAPASFGMDTAGVLSFGGLDRTYQLHVPAGVDHPAGLVINLHGAGETGGAQASLTNYNAVADQHGFAVVYPDGIDFSWADGRGASIPDRQGVDDVGFLVALAERLKHDYGIEPGHVFATGLSAGAFMAMRLACQRADVVAAIAPVAGSLGSAVPCAPSRPVSVFATNGASDPVVPYNGGGMVGRGGTSDIVAPPAMAGRWRDLDHCPAAPVEDAVSAEVHRFTASGCADGTEVVFVRVNGGGHEWFGGASDVSAQFFATHAR